MTENSAKAAGKRSRHASRASLACTRCKRAKRKCDISQSPNGDHSCTSCRLKNEQCDIRIEDDRRRGKPRQTTKELQSRIAALEGLIRKNVANEGVGSWPTTNDHLDSSDDFGDYGQPVEESEPQTARTLQYDVAGNILQEPSRAVATTSSMLSPMMDMLTPGNSMQNQPPAPRSPGTDPTHNAAPEGASRTQKPPSTISNESSTVMDEVTARAGELKGRDARKMQYFGATSMFYHGDEDGAYQQSEGSVDDLASRRLSIATISIEAEPKPIVVHLLELFFDWQAPHLSAVDRDTFMSHWALSEENEDYDDRTFYSPALLYAILSLASLISPDRGVRRYSSSNGGVPGDRFLRKARALLDIDIGNSTVTTVQAALLVGSWYGAVGQTSLGWSYSGLTFRMCFELGLQMDCSRAVIQGQMSRDVAENRKRVFWGCYMQDKLWSAYCGRPSFFMDWDISVDTPEGVLSGMVYLSKRCAETLLSLYSQRHNSKPDGLLKVATRIHKDICRWQENLPAELDWPRGDGNGPPSPGILIMHMQSYFVLILIHRPLLHMSVAQHEMANSDRGTIDSAAVCTLAATNIAKLVRDYQQFYSLRRISSTAVHFTFIAATIHIVNFRLFKEERYQFLLHGCLAALTEMGESYPIGRKAVCVLQDLIGRWKPQTETVRQKKNAPQSMVEHHDVLWSDPEYNSISRLEQGSGFVETESQTQKNMGHPWSDSQITTQRYEPFDWSEYSSPVELPPLFDASMIPMSDPEFQAMESEAPTEHGSASAYAEYPLFSGYHGGSLATNDRAFNLGQSLDEATLASFYGTSFALMN